MLGWVDDTARSRVANAARRHGRELAALAYLVLQHRSASEAAAAAGLADVLRAHADEPQWGSMVGAVLRRALEGHGRIREIDAPGEATASGADPPHPAATGHRGWSPDWRRFA